MNNQQITNRLHTMMSKIVADTKHCGEKSPMYSDAKKVETIVLAVHRGQSKISRLATADKILSKWGF